ncbi:MAG: MBL fold metallo-hydrolase [Clostridia bacterium]|nr:MBL fold metallo-hydrolase [Clostridia bacterium]
MDILLMQYSTKASHQTEEFRWQAAGMGYAIRSEKERFIVVDGGHKEDAEGLITFLEQHADGKPEIDQWIITHPHGDHYGALEEASNRADLRERVQVNRFVFCMPPESFVDSGRGTPYKEQIQTVWASAARFGAPVTHAKRGERYVTDSLETEVLLTYDDLDFASDPNETSMLFFVHAAEQRILFLGDTYEAPAEKLAAEREDLSSTFCQFAHHALNGASDSLYEKAVPRVGLIPMARPAYVAMTQGDYKDTDETGANRRAMAKLPTEKLWLSADGHYIVKLPYKG